MRTKIGNYFRRVFDIHSDMMSYEEIDEMMKKNTAATLNFSELSEKQVIENWLIAESGIAKAKLLLNLNR
ncbi:MAG: hypothetical protein ACI4IM_00120 [Acutalibacteraceae bacterium]